MEVQKCWRCTHSLRQRSQNTTTWQTDRHSDGRTEMVRSSSQHTGVRQKNSVLRLLCPRPIHLAIFDSFVILVACQKYYCQAQQQCVSKNTTVEPTRKTMWTAVRELTDGDGQRTALMELMLLHWTITTPASPQITCTYATPLLKQSATPIFSLVSRKNVCSTSSTNWSQRQLESTCIMPAWFLRLVAPIFCRHLANLINLSFSTSMVPLQWKQARVCPVPKISNPVPLSDFRPISVTAVLSRVT